MGNFRIVIDAAGGHGCDRVAKPGETLQMPPHGAPDFHERYCPDCQAYAFVRQLASTMPVVRATFTHWPDQPEEVVDDITTTRPYRKSGQFPG